MLCQKIINSKNPDGRLIKSGKEFMPFKLFSGPLPKDVKYQRSSTPTGLTPPSSPAPSSSSSMDSMSDTDTEIIPGKI